MKNLPSLLLLLLTCTLSYAQINISEGKGDQSGRQFVDQKSTAVPIKSSSKDSMRHAFKTFDFELLSTFLSKGLQTELPELQSVLGDYTKKFNSKGKVYFKDNVSNGYSRSGTLGTAEFTNSIRQIGSLEIMYNYRERGRPRINNIMLLEDGTVIHDFPKVIDRIKDLQKQIRSDQSDKEYLKTVRSYREIVKLASNLEDYYENPDDGRKQKSQFYGNLSWNLLLTNQPAEAIQYAEKGLEIWEYNEWIYTNVALGYALNDDFEKASAVYEKWCKEYYRGDKRFADAFISDLERMKSEGLTVPKYAEYIQLIENCRAK
ncbi:MAG: hypothetical protein AAFV95_14700 [Bacteroidota bacterium]